MNRIDLHTHSTASDGTMTPSELIDYAVQKSLSAIAITDHDTMDGYAQAYEQSLALKDNGIDIEVIPGTEFSSSYLGKDIHILGLYIDPSSEYFKRRCDLNIKNRTKRNLQMCDLCTEHGMKVSYEDLLNEFPNSVITRAHFAKYLYNHGYVKSVKEAFDRFVGDGCVCYVSRKKVSPFRAVEMIRKSGGVPILAHPFQYKFSKHVLEDLIVKLKAVGLMGMEVIYSTHTPSDERYLRSLCQKYNLVPTGGSDFHGANKPDIDLGFGRGHLFIPDELLKDIKNARDKVRNESATYNIPKVLFTDLDGTLLKDDKTISSYTYQVLSDWSQKGHYIALCSGRDINSMRDVYHEIGLDKLSNVFLIGYNGGELFNCTSNQTLYKKTLSNEDIDYIDSVALSMGIHFQTYSDNYIITHEDDEELKYYQRVIKTPVRFSNVLSNELSNGSCKCLAIELHDTNKLVEFKNRLSLYCSDHNITMLFSNDNYMEVFPADSGKGASVPELCKLLGIPNIITVGAGDEQNDISMLKACDVAIAMENGTFEVKNSGTMVSLDDNNHDGLALSLIDIM